MADAAVAGAATTLAAVVARVGSQSEAYAAPCFARCVSLVERAEAAAASGAFDPEEAAEFVVCALDLIRYGMVWRGGGRAGRGEWREGGRRERDVSCLPACLLR